VLGCRYEWIGSHGTEFSLALVWLAIEEFAEAGVTGAADGELCSVVEHRDVAIFAVGLDAGDSFEIDDVGAVDAKESRRVEGGFEAGDGLLFEMLFVFRAEGDVVVLGFGVVELGDGDDENLGAVTDWDAVEMLSWGASGGGEVGW
jgi:hypothetical protein